MMLTAILLAACVPMTTFSPTPVVTWDHVADTDLAGYTIYYREPGGVWQKVVDFPCEMRDLDGDEIEDEMFCRGPHIGAPLQRYCATCAPLTSYEFAVKAYDAVGNISTEYSNTVSVCFSPLCVKPGPCS